MKEGDLHVVGAGPRLVIAHSQTGLFQFSDAIADARHDKGNVVQTRPD
ncbi:MAG TPA: hypothetical protein VMS17_24390 [Gemmataceae bacterium]|nr:hypothetical protein [Gemmataceae bacterium]